jgi:hypothetical protein
MRHTDSGTAAVGTGAFGTGAEQQALFEHELLAHIAGALRTTIDWALHTQECSSRLPSLRFIAHSFQRHLEHILDLEERDGYMPAIDGHRHADLRGRIDELRAEHERFRQLLRESLERLEMLSASDYLTLHDVSAGILLLLDEINDHNQREMLLIEQARERDDRDRLLGLL